MQTSQRTALRARERRENLIGYAYMAPALVFFLGFVIFPMGMALVTSLTDYSMDSFNFVGLANYARMLRDRVFGKAMVNTVLIVAVSTASPAKTRCSMFHHSVRCTAQLGATL